MKKISICSWCGQPFEIDENEAEVDVCGDCNFYDSDSIGMLEDEDFAYLKGKE